MKIVLWAMFRNKVAVHIAFNESVGGSVMINKREHERFDLKVPSKIFLSKCNKEENSIHSFTRNISESGAYVYTNKPYSVHEEIEAEFYLSVYDFIRNSARWSVVTVNGVVCRSDKLGMAICFTTKCDIHSMKEIVAFH